jgi:hypothetical protein
MEFFTIIGGYLAFKTALDEHIKRLDAVNWNYAPFIFND